MQPAFALTAASNGHNFMGSQLVGVMFGHKLSSIPNQNYRVETHPTIEQLNEIIEKARAMFGIKHNYLWEIPNDFKKYTLSIHCKESDGEDIEWWLHEENIVGTKMVWFHKTKDIAVIYPHLLTAVGAKHPLEETAEDKAKAERDKEHKSTSLGERFRKSTTSAELIQAPTIEEERANAAAVTSPADSAESSTMRLMTGSLKLRPIAWLLQTAQQSEITGELRVTNEHNRIIVVQFGLGRPIHAYTTDKVGTDAILEIFSWQEGSASFIEGTQPDTASVQDSTEEILKQGSKLLENLGFLMKNGMDDNSILSRPPIGLSEEQLEERLKDGIDYGFRVQRAFYTTLDGQLSLKEVGARISLDSCRLLAIAVNFLRLGLVLTPDGRSLRQVAHSASSDAFANAQVQAQSGAQPALKPPAGFFGGAGFGAGAPNSPAQVQAAPDAPSFNASNGVPPAGATTSVPNQIAAPAFRVSGDQTPTTFNVGPAPASGGVTSDTVSGDVSTVARSSNLVPNVPQFAQELSGRQTALSSPALAGPPKSRDFFEVGVPSNLLDFDSNSVKSVFSSLTDSQTGALTYPAFQFMLEREFARAFRFSSEFSLLIFCIRLGGGDASRPSPAASVMPMNALSLATQAISQIKRDVDVFGHVGDRAFGLILPGVGTNQSHALVDRIVADLPKLASKLGGYWPILHFGIAGVPDDARDLASLFHAAQNAMIHAAHKNYTRIRSADLRA